MNKKFANILNKQEKEDGKAVLSEKEIVKRVREEFENGDEILKLAASGSVPVKRFFSDGSVPTEWPVVPIRKSETFSVRKHTSAMRPYFHAHRFYEIVSVRRGECRQSLKAPDRTLVLKEGELSIVSPGVVHAIERACARDVVLKLIVPVPLYTETAQPIFGDRPAESVRVFRDVSAEADYFLFKLLDADLNRTECRSAVVKSYLTLLFAELARAPARRDGVLADRLEEYFENCSGSASLGDFASSMMFSEGYTGRLIKDKLGKTFSEFLTLYRLKTAAEQLVETENSVEEIAETVGYSNASGLYKQFCGFYGMTPNAYRKMFR